MFLVASPGIHVWGSSYHILILNSASDALMEGIGGWGAEHSPISRGPGSLS